MRGQELAGTTIYLNPTGLLWGPEAADAKAAGLAGLLAGGPTGFTAIEIIDRTGGAVAREWRTYASIGTTREPAVAQRLELIEAPRPRLAGLDLSRPCIMGIINVTPDSFSDGGEHSDPETAIAHGRRLAEEGAAILDVGGESTRPFSDPMPYEIERDRALPVIEQLAAEGHIVSVDTRKAAIMRDAAAAGARIINDVSALSHDPASLATARDLGLPVVLMHAQGDPKTMQIDPRYDDARLDIFDYLEARITECENRGLPRSLLVADPGLGFGKTHTHNLELLGGLALFHGLGVPLLVGASRKGFIGKLTGVTAAGRRAVGSVGAAVAAVMQGAQIVRVHDVIETRQAVAVWQGAMHDRTVRD